jgi:hypothetical protein
MNAPECFRFWYIRVGTYNTDISVLLVISAVITEGSPPCFYHSSPASVRMCKRYRLTVYTVLGMARTLAPAEQGFF